MALLVTIYTLTSSGRFHIVDEVSLFAVTESQALRGAIDTNAIAWTQWVNSAGEVLGAFGPEGDVYSKKGPAPALLAVPWYLLLHIITELNVGIGQLQATLLWNGIVTAVTAALLWLTARRLGYSDRTGMALGLLFGLATIAWPYANQFFGEPVSALALLLIFYGMATWRRLGGWWWLALAGVGAAVALTTVTAHMLLIAVFGGWWLVDWLWRRRTDAATGAVTAWLAGAAAFVTPIVVGGALLALYNYVRFGDVFETGYHFDSGEGFSTPFLAGFWGLIFSPYRGVFWHTPLLIASIVAFAPFGRRHRSEAILIALLSGVLVGMYSLWWMWWGGFAWGPRFLVPLTPLWVLVLAPVVETLLRRQRSVHRKRKVASGDSHSPSQSPNRSIAQSPDLQSPTLQSRHRPILAWFAAAMALISFVVQIGAVSVNFVNYEILLRNIYPTNWEDPLEFGPPAQALTDMLNSPVIGQFKLIAQGLPANSDLAWLWADGTLLWLVVLIGAAAVATLGGALVLWWRIADQPEPVATQARASGVVSAPSLVLVILAPMLVIATWTGEVGREPTYGPPDSGYRAIIHDLCHLVTPTDAFVNVAPTSYHIPMNWMPGECKIDIPTFGYAPDSMNHPETEKVLTRVLSQNDRIWFVTSGVQPNDPDNTLERWLADHAYKATDDWYADFRMVQYATALRLAGVEERPIGKALLGRRAEQVTILSARAPSVAAAGKPIPIDLQYRLEAPTDQNLRWFVQLLSGQNIPLAQLDTGPNDNYVTFSSLPAREPLTERAGLLVPENTPEGDYLLIVGLYNPDDEGARLITIDGPDFVSLGAVRVVKSR